MGKVTIICRGAFRCRCGGRSGLCHLPWGAQAGGRERTRCLAPSFCLWEGRGSGCPELPVQRGTTHGHWLRKAFPTCDPGGANQSPSPWDLSDWSRETDLSSCSGKRKAVGPEPPGTSFPTRSRSLGEGQSCHGGRGHNNGGVLLALSP